MLLLPLRVYVTGFFENRAFRLAHVRPAGQGQSSNIKERKHQAPLMSSAILAGQRGRRTRISLHTTPYSTPGTERVLGEYVLYTVHQRP